MSRDVFKTNNQNTENKKIQTNSCAPVTKEIQELETKQTTVRLKTEINERLQTICREEGICREVLIEAMFEYFEANPKSLNKVLIKAKDKNQYRQHIANKRRAKSMIERFG